MNMPKEYADLFALAKQLDLIVAGTGILSAAFALYVASTRLRILLLLAFCPLLYALFRPGIFVFQKPMIALVWIPCVALLWHFKRASPKIFQWGIAGILLGSITGSFISLREIVPIAIADTAWQFYSSTRWIWLLWPALGAGLCMGLRFILNRLRLKASQPRKSKLKPAIAILLGLLLLRMCVFFPGVSGQVVDASTGKPLPNIKVKLKITACIGSQLVNVGGCNSKTVFEKQVLTDENGTAVIPREVRFIHPISFIRERTVRINVPDAKEIVYLNEGADVFYGRGPWVWLTGTLDGPESLMLKEAEFSQTPVRLVPLRPDMTLEDCPASMPDMERRRCIFHLAVRELQPLEAFAYQNGAEPYEISLMRGLLNSYYRLKAFGNCDSSGYCDQIRDYASVCPNLAEAFKKTKVVSKQVQFPQMLQTECEKLKISTPERQARPPLLPLMIPSVESCQRYPESLRKHCEDVWPLRKNPTGWPDL